MSEPETGTGAKILVVEDEESLSRMLKSTLVQLGYNVTTARTGSEALKEITEQKFGVVLLDLGLPDLDGKQVIEEARRHTLTPFVVISARGAEKEKIAALDLGANDYLAKPFDMGELLARIRVALRPPPPSHCTKETRTQGLVIDAPTRRAIIDGAAVRLSQKETEFLQLLDAAKGEIVSYDRIREAIWGRSDVDFMNVRVLAWQVRRKIEPDPSAPRFLIAEMGEGYRLNFD